MADDNSVNGQLAKAAHDKYKLGIDDEHVLLRYQVPIEEIDEYAKEQGWANKGPNEATCGLLDIWGGQMASQRDINILRRSGFITRTMTSKKMN
jgi:hypothetical protein